MSERVFRLFTGLTLLVALYFDLPLVIYGLVAWFTFEVVINRRLTTMLSRLRYGDRELVNKTSADETHKCRINFEAERALRLVLVLVLLLTLSHVLFHGQLWIVTWFVGFALIAAGLSGVCPMIMALKKIGFR